LVFILKKRYPSTFSYGTDYKDVLIERLHLLRADDKSPLNSI